MSCSLLSLQSNSLQDSWKFIMLTQLPHSHERVREVEYELFRYKLKPSVDGALISDIIRSSSSGLNSYRTATMELLIERSIQERRERIFEKAKNSSRSDPAPQAKRTSVAPNISIPEAQPLAPAPALQPPSQSLPNDTTGTVTSLASASAEYEASQDSSRRLKSAKKIEGATRCEEPSADVNTNPFPSEDCVELECEGCHLKRLRSSLILGACAWCCFVNDAKMKCVGCGTIRAGGVDACAGCHRKFK